MRWPESAREVSPSSRARRKKKNAALDGVRYLGLAPRLYDVAAFAARKRSTDAAACAARKRSTMPPRARLESAVRCRRVRGSKAQYDAAACAARKRSTMPPRARLESAVRCRRVRGSKAQYHAAACAARKLGCLLAAFRWAVEEWASLTRIAEKDSAFSVAPGLCDGSRSGRPPLAP